MCRFGVTAATLLAAALRRSVSFTFQKPMRSLFIHWSLRIPLAAFCLGALGVGLAAGADQAPAEPAKPVQGEKEVKWTSLFDGKTLEGWQRSDFAGGGEPAVEEGALVIPTGERLSGVTWVGKAPPKTNYEVVIEAKRIDGADFFCGLTVPVRNSFVSLIVGGWGGTVVGISSLDGADAANNMTTQVMRFNRGQWYSIRLRVTDKAILAWIDGDEVVNVDTSEKKLSTRGEVEASKPFGVSTFQTTAALRKIQIRELLPEELKDKDAAKN